MALNLNYQDFFRSSFLVEYRKLGLSTNDFLSFANSLIGVENFIRNHPIPILEYYWVCNGGMNKLVESIAYRLGICLKKIKVVSSEKDVDYADKNVYYIFPEYLDSMFNSVDCYGGINAVKSDIAKARFLADLKSNDIILNEGLWENCELVQSCSRRISSDEFEYYSIFKTGWAYLSENRNIELDLLLISYLKNKIIALEKEQYDEYAGFRFGRNPSAKKSANGLMTFRTHPISKNIVSIILNDPIQWEGIFYDQSFCNNSILQYVKNLVPELKEHFFDL